MGLGESVTGGVKSLNPGVRHVSRRHVQMCWGLCLGVSRVLGKVLEDLHMRGPRQPSGGLGNPGSGAPIDGALSRLPLLEKKFHSLHPEHETWIRKHSTRTTNAFHPKRSPERWEPRGLLGALPEML